jgi:hypothetical protein
MAASNRKHGFSRRSTRLRLLLAMFLLSAPAHLTTITAVSAAEGPVDVDLELILAVDISDSMNPEEQRLQRDGYVSAFRHPDIVAAIQSGGIGKIAVLYLEWAGPAYQRVGVPWTIIGNPEDASSVADALAALPLKTEAGTSISASFLQAMELFASAEQRTGRQVIDISGDGVNNFGPPVAPIRALLVSKGIIINGLPIVLLNGAGDSNMSFGRPFLERYYEDCVIGGSGAFVIGVEGMSRFETALRRKLVMEIAGRAEALSPAAYVPQPKSHTDCEDISEHVGR